jgi:DNA-binding response OmpR family regulator
MIPGVTDGTRGRILVVDDDLGIRQMITLALGDAGFDVVPSDGEGVAQLGSDFAAVILDLRLGRHSALDVLREAPALVQRPLVIMTAASEERLALDGLPSHTLLPKPFDLGSLEEAITTARARGR